MTPTSIRLPERLEERIRDLAAEERRTFSNMVVVLLEQALGDDGTIIIKDEADRTVKRIPEVQADAQPRDVPARTVAPADPHFKPDFKEKGK